MATGVRIAFGWFVVLPKLVVLSFPRVSVEALSFVFFAAGLDFWAWLRSVFVLRLSFLVEVLTFRQTLLSLFLVWSTFLLLERAFSPSGWRCFLVRSFWLVVAVASFSGFRGGLQWHVLFGDVLAL